MVRLLCERELHRRQRVAHRELALLTRAQLVERLLHFLRPLHDALASETTNRARSLRAATMAGQPMTVAAGLRLSNDDHPTPEGARTMRKLVETPKTDA